MSKKSLHEYYKRNFYDYKRPYKSILGEKFTTSKFPVPSNCPCEWFCMGMKKGKYLLFSMGYERLVSYYKLRKYYV